jgi:uncharacterized protein (UPF0332 family)
MSQEERDELVRYRMRCSRESLDEAILLMERELWRGSINRLYYAMFYAAVALLATRDVYPKTHKGVRQQFGMLFVIPGMVGRELGDAYSELFERRHSSDYDDFVDVEGDVVTRLHDYTVAMIETIEGIIVQK